MGQYIVINYCPPPPHHDKKSQVLHMPGYDRLFSKSCEITLEEKSMKCKCGRQLEYNNKKTKKKMTTFQNNEFCIHKKQTNKMSF